MRSKTVFPLKKAWLLTFTDLMTLLLTFFVMLYAMGTPKLYGGVNKEQNPFIGFSEENNKLTLSVKPTFMKRGVNLAYLHKVLSDERIHLPEYQFTLLNDELILRLPISIFMDQDKMVIHDVFRQNIRELGYLLNNLSNKIAVVGLTPSELEKGISFAASVSNELRKGGYKDDIPVLAHENKLLETPQIEIIIYPYNRERFL